MTNQLNEANELLQKMLPNITLQMKKDYIAQKNAVHYNTLKKYLKCEGKDVDTALNICEFFSEKIFITQTQLDNVKRN